jgi:hypothetical protein
MNFPRILLAGFAAFAIYFVLGGLAFTIPSMKDEFRKYPAVYRSQDDIKNVMPTGMAAMLLGMLTLAVLYALIYRGGSGLAEGARFGALIALYSLCSFVIHNYVNLNIGWKLTMQQAIAYSIEWLAVGIVIGLIYKPL